MAAAAVALALLAGSSAAQRASDGSSAVTGNAMPPKVQELLTLLGDPAVRQWLEESRATQIAAERTVPRPEKTLADYVAARLDAIHAHLASLIGALPRLPTDFAHAGMALHSELQRLGVAGGLLLLAVFTVLGSVPELLFRRWTGEARKRNDKLRVERVGDRLRAIVMRLTLDIGSLAVFVLGSASVFLTFDWPPILRDVVLGYLMATLALRSALVLGRFLLAPGNDDLRIVPMSAEAASFWFRRLALLVGWFVLGWATVGMLTALGFFPETRQIVAYALGLVLLAIGLEIAWRRPSGSVERDHRGLEARLGRAVSAWLLSAYFVTLWMAWVASALPFFWLAVVLLALPLAMRATRRAVTHGLRPAGENAPGEDLSHLRSVFVERGARAALIIGAALLLARGWHVDLVNLAAEETAASRLLAGALSAVVVFLVADLAWQLTKAFIDSHLVEAQKPSQPGTEGERRRMRMRTLLPMLRKLLFTVIAATAVMTALAHLGVQIGPLIAGAGIFGIAIGFGSQTLVKDIVSGTFYLLDDAFRVGEYIQSGNYKGTVESFSIRSVKLRHHRGPLYTVPFGALGAIQNMSRDWVIDKLAVGITYDSDLELARKLIKQIGKKLAEDPEFAPHIIEPLKMQGVEQFGDFAVQIRLKMMTLPGEQFQIRRRAYAMIKKAFDANGIKFAFPTVQVAESGEATAAASPRVPTAAAQKVIELGRSGASS